MAAALLMFASPSAGSAVEPMLGSGPLLSKVAIERAAKECAANVTVLEIPPGLDGPGSENDPVELHVGVDRGNDEESLKCFANRVPVVIVAPIGRAPNAPVIKAENVDIILKRCRWRKSDGKVVFVEPDEVRLSPDPKASYKRLDCVLNGLRPYDPNMGFIGNEAYTPEEQPK